MTGTTIALLERLVSFPTTGGASNDELVAFVAPLLEAAGARVRVLPRPGGRTASLLASVGPQTRGGLLLSGHVDVVPADPAEWSSDPFRLRDDGAGRLYARGATDMKGFVASALAALIAAGASAPLVPIHLALSCDEESDCRGALDLIEAITEMGLEPRYCIVGEPTSMKIGVGHKGKTAFRIVCRGLERHSADAPLAPNAIYMASELIGCITRRQAEIERTGHRDPGYEVPYTTLHVGTIRGGSTLNIVPSSCEMEIEFREIAGDDPDELSAAIVSDARETEARWRGRFPEASVEIVGIMSNPGLETATNEEIVALLRRHTSRTGDMKLPFGTEAGLFRRRLNVPTVVCGPGSMEQGHRPDEWIERAELDACDAMLQSLMAGEFAN